MTVVEVRLTCQVCGNKHVLYLKLEKDMPLITGKWLCNNCQSVHTCIISRGEIQEELTEAKLEVRYFQQVYKEGERTKKIEVDSEGKLIEKGGFWSNLFGISYPGKRKKKEEETIWISNK